MTINIAELLAPKPGQDDTVVQAQIRACLIASLEGLSAADQVGVALDLIGLLQYQMLSALADVRRRATRAALESGMSHQELAHYTGFSRAQIARLSTEANRAAAWDAEAAS
jgi:hypothetical protein